MIGTGGKTNDANIGNGDVPDVVLEDAGAPADKDTQYWHVVTEPNGGTTLLNKSGGRAAAFWTGNPTVGQKIGQWLDNSATGSWNLVRTADGYYRFQFVKNTNVYLTGASRGAALTLQNALQDGSQDWQLVQQAPTTAALTKDDRSKHLVTAQRAGGKTTLSLNAAAADPAGTALHANTTGHAYLVAADGKATDLGPVSFDAAQRGSVTLPQSAPGRTKFKIAVVFDDTPLMWDAITVPKAAGQR